MDEPDTVPPSPAEVAEPTEEGKQASAGGSIRWRYDLLAGLVAGAAFMLLITLASMIEAGLVWPACIVFLPGGIWVGRHSHRSWTDGAVYGLATTVLVALILLARGFVLGSLFALFLVLPQGLLGAWIGARLWPAAAGSPRSPGAQESPDKAL